MGIAPTDRDRLVEDHRALVVHLARRHRRPGVELDDLVQAGYLGLLRAARKFDPGRGVKFSSYAYEWVWTSVARAAARDARRAAAGSGPGDADPAALAADDAPGPEAEAEAADDAEDLARRLARLDDRSRAVVALRFGLDDGTPRTFADVGAEFGLTREWARKATASALGRLGAPGPAS